MSTPPLTVTKLIEGGRGLAPVLVKRAASVCLDWDVRQKSRFDATDSLGRRIGVFLPRGRCVRGGDVLVAEDGSMLRVDAARQPVLRVSACPQHGSPFDLLRAAYHLGNRHVALELRPDHLKLEPDHVLAEMLTRMHLIVTPADEAFEPESGAYAAAGHDAHGHGGHGHGHDHDHGHGQDAAASHDHDHGHGESDGKPRDDPKHDHGHDHGHAQAHHGHGHAHGGAHDHDHDHGHDHGHDKPGHGHG